MSEIDDLRAALEPFARTIADLEKYEKARGDNDPVTPIRVFDDGIGIEIAYFTYGDLRRARDAYNKLAAPLHDSSFDLRAALTEATTNGEWTEGEQRGNWMMSKEVYETMRDALAAPRPSPDKGRRTGSGALHGRPLDEDGAIEFRPSPEKDDRREVFARRLASYAREASFATSQGGDHRMRVPPEFMEDMAASAALALSDVARPAAVARARAEAFQEAMRTVRNEMPSGHPLRYAVIEALRRARAQGRR